MQAFTTLVSMLSVAAAVGAKVVSPRAGTTSNGTVVDATFDGYCFYPKPDPTFDVSTYGGTWYQVAGYVFIFTATCTCITAEYTLKADGTVGVVSNSHRSGRPMPLSGHAHHLTVPADQPMPGAGASHHHHGPRGRRRCRVRRGRCLRRGPAAHRLHVPRAQLHCAGARGGRLCHRPGARLQHAVHPQPRPECDGREAWCPRCSCCGAGLA